MEENMNKFEIKIYKEYCEYECQTSELIQKYMNKNGGKVDIYLPKQNITVIIKRVAYPEIFLHSDGTIIIYLDGGLSTTNTQLFNSKKDKDKLIKAIPIIKNALEELTNMAECKTFTIEF